MKKSYEIPEMTVMCGDELFTITSAGSGERDFDMKIFWGDGNTDDIDIYY